VAARLATLPADGPTGGFFDDAGGLPRSQAMRLHAGINFCFTPVARGITMPPILSSKIVGQSNGV
jgi:hypothetical protein